MINSKKKEEVKAKVVAAPTASPTVAKQKKETLPDGPAKVYSGTDKFNGVWNKQNVESFVDFIITPEKDKVCLAHTRAKDKVPYLKSI